MATYFTSDLHHKHKKILNFTERNKVTDVENHTDWLVSVWNSRVKPGDTVYHLGDISFSNRYLQLSQFVSRLNGDIYLIKGNHDNPQFMKQLLKDKLIVWYGDYKEIVINQVKTVLFHYPISSWRAMHYGSYHLFGHCHGNFNPPGKSIDVGLDSVYNLFGEYKVLSENEIDEFLKEREINAVDHHT